MRSKLWAVLAVLIVLLLAAYLTAGWYFSEILLNMPTETIAEARA